MLTFWLVVYFVEILMLTTPLWITSRYLAPALVLGVTTSSFWLALALKPLFAAALVFLAIFRLVNLLRVIKGRMHRYYLFFASRRTTVIIAGMHLALVGAVAFINSLFEVKQLIVAAFALQFILAVLIAATVAKNVTKLRFKMPKSRLSDDDLPTVTVAIPARNETRDLEECLKTVLDSDYPKLEIIVLDDCSHAKTAEVIKSFAHSGVRFVQGEQPHTRWLAKNQAYQKLYQEATGQLILFMGVDARLGKSAIRAMVNVMKSKNKHMISVLPKRVEAAKDAVFIQPMRYWWELAPPRKLFNRPPVLSTCWLVEKDFLRSKGGFASVSHSILPEGFFARQAILDNGYSFIRTSGELQVRTQKTYQEQRETALRVKYPQIRRRPENVLVITLVEVFLLLLPIIFLTPPFWSLGALLLMPVGSLALLAITHVAIVKITNPANALLAALSFPVAVITELILGYTSMLKYEFGQVIWKERNICMPVMHVIPKLPKID